MQYIYTPNNKRRMDSPHVYAPNILKHLSNMNWIFFTENKVKKIIYKVLATLNTF